MPTNEDTRITEVLASVVSEDKVSDLALAHGFIQRFRDVHPYDFVWNLVLGFGTGRERKLAGLRRSYELATGETIARSSFAKKFNPGLVEVLKELLTDALTDIGQDNEELDGLLTKFRDVVATDAMVIRLKEGLEKFFPGCRTNQSKSAAKLHAVMSVFPNGQKSVRISPERLSDSRALRIGPWVKKRLLLMDLGYFGYQMFSRIVANGGSFISRLKKKVNPVITKCNMKWRGRSTPLVGRKLQEVLPLLQREILDVQVEVNVKKRVYRGVRRTVRQEFRVVGVLDEASGEYHLYITDVPPEVFSAEEVAQLYAARWAVELWFRELSSMYRVKDMPSANPNVVKALIYAALLTISASHRILHLLKLRLGELARRARPERMAAALEQAGALILRLLTSPWASDLREERMLEDVLMRQVLDPNADRPCLLQRVTQGSQLAYYRKQYGGARA